MVCDKCQEKLSTLCVPDKWKEGAKNTVAGGGMKAGKSNKALQRKKHSEQWIPANNICRICKSKVQAKMNYCNDCAHCKGICAMCGRKALDIGSHKMSLK
mmetsp:Transcript_61/g.55  ORF Transcript_61/g.55 Transcript_61/m.55 type:complete len:100 (+) Transcript_61:158-457(+)